MDAAPGNVKSTGLAKQALRQPQPDHLRGLTGGLPADHAESVGQSHGLEAGVDARPEQQAEPTPPSENGEAAVIFAAGLGGGVGPDFLDEANASNSTAPAAPMNANINYTVNEGSDLAVARVDERAAAEQQVRIRLRRNDSLRRDQTEPVQTSQMWRRAFPWLSETKDGQ